ncbi:hypothetical protein GGF43_006120, partial [Coemansia sp. RSA 2618]
YITLGSRLIFREGRTKGVGKVMRVLSAAEERQALHKATNGTMVIDERAEKIKLESIRHNTGAVSAPATEGKAHKVLTKS